MCPLKCLSYGARKRINCRHKCNEKKKYFDNAIYQKQKTITLVTHCIFDLDGTLINSEIPYQDIVKELCAEYGKEYPTELRHSCLVFEDTMIGLLAAIAAGMQVVLTPSATSDQSYAKQATLVLKNLLEFKPELFGLPPFDR